MYHYIRDCPVYNNGGADNGGWGESNYVYYHFLRTAGWEWIWECDGVEDNHCADANMEDSGTASWVAQGTGSIIKTTAQKHMIRQSLAVTSSVTNDGVRSVALVNVADSVTYRLTLWAYNNTGQAWDVQVDPGDSSFASVGTIPSDGVWARYDFTFSTVSTGSRYFQVLDTNNSQGTIYLDSVMVFQSWFEYRGVDAEDFSGTPDGEILNSNEFSSASYSFVAGDIGKYICIWDPTNVGNSGVYRISSLNGLDAVMDLRASGSPALTAQTGLRWRMIDVTQAARIYDPGVTTELYAGWGLESPHSEKWRFFMRNNWNTSSDRSWLNTWSSPTDSDFDVETGFFWGGMSTEIRRGTYVKGGVSSGQGYFFVSQCSFQVSTFKRLYLQTDDDGSFVFMTAREGDGTHVNYEASQAIGFTGSDSYHTLQESFVHFGRIEATIETSRTLYWGSSGSGAHITHYGQQVSGGGALQFDECTWMCLGYGTATADIKNGYSNERTNPFSGGGHFLLRPKIARGYYGYETSAPSEKDIATWGIWDGMETVSAWTGIDSNQYFHIAQGVFMEMPSSGGVGLFDPLP
jgi:hypothetical protein